MTGSRVIRLMHMIYSIEATEIPAVAIFNTYQRLSASLICIYIQHVLALLVF